MITFVIFRADTMNYAIDMIGHLFYGTGSNALTFSLLTPIYITAFIFAVITASKLGEAIYSRTKQWIRSIFSILIYVLSIIMLISGGYNPFIYFRF